MMIMEEVGLWKNCVWKYGKCDLNGKEKKDRMEMMGKELLEDAGVIDSPNMLYCLDAKYLFLLILRLNVTRMRQRAQIISVIKKMIIIKNNNKVDNKSECKKHFVEKD